MTAFIWEGWLIIFNNRTKGYRMKSWSLSHPWPSVSQLALSEVTNVTSLLCIQKSLKDVLFPMFIIRLRTLYIGYKSSCISDPTFVLPKSRIAMRFSFRINSWLVSYQYSSTFIHYVLLKTYKSQMCDPQTLDSHVLGEA